MRRERVVLRQLHLAHVDEHEVAALRLGVREVEFLEDFVEAVHLALHFVDGLGPEVVRVGLFEADGAGFLEGGDGGVADSGVGGGDVLEEVGGADEPAYSPAGGVKVLARGADGESELLDLGREGRDAREGDVEEPVVDFIGEDDDLVLDAEVADTL